MESLTLKCDISYSVVGADSRSSVYGYQAWLSTWLSSSHNPTPPPPHAGLQGQASLQVSLTQS